MRYIAIALIFLLSTSIHAAEFIPKKLSQMTDDLGVGTHTADTSDPHGVSMTQTNLTVGSLTVTNSLSLGTATLSGYVKDNGGSATATQLTSVQINSGTATLSGVASPYIAQNNGTASGLTLSGTNIINGVTAPYIAQTSGTGSGNTLNNTKLSGNTAIGTTTVATDVVDIDLGSGNMLIQSSSGYPQTQEIRGGAAADGNLLATKIYQGKDSAGNSTNYAGIYAVSSNVTNGSETGSIDFYLSDVGSYAFRGRWKGANLGIGTSTPANKLTVAGTIESTTGGVKFPDGNTQTEAVTQLVKGIAAGTGISIDQSTGTVTVTNTGLVVAGGWTDGTNTVYVTVAADQVIIGSTTAASNQILTVVGSQTTTDLNVKNAMSLAFTGTPTIDLAIGDNDTGLEQSSDNVIAIVAGGASTLVVDGSTNRVRIGTSTLNTTLQVGGTITATGFSGNGAGLTDLPSSTVAFSDVTGSATSSQLPLISSLLGSATSAQLPTVIRLPGTTTNQAAQAYGQLYVQSSSNTIAATGTHTISGGTASASNVANGAAANAFDNDTGTKWETGNPGFPIWIQYQFTETKIVDTIRIWNYSNEWGTFTVQASNNGSTFDNFGNFMHGTSTDSTPQTYTFSNGAGYTYWRLNHTSNPYRGDSYSGIREVQFAHTQNVEHTQYSAKYLDPVTGNAVYEILTPGTATTQASYIYCNATTTVFGLGTNTAITATSTAYSGWFAGAVRATAFNVASTEKIKENIKPIKIKPDLLDAEGLAKLNYITNNKIAWIAANGGSYTTVINETGTGSVIVVDTDTMESDYNNYIELEWASDPNQDMYTETIQKTYEKGFWQMFDSVAPRSWNPKDRPSLTRKGFVVEDMPDVVKGDDGQSIDPMALIAYISLVQQTLKADTIFALSTLKELITTGTVTQQKIDYVNDRLEVLNP